MTQKLNLVKGQTVYIKCKVAETEVAGDYPIRLTHEGGHTNADYFFIQTVGTISTIQINAYFQRMKL